MEAKTEDKNEDNKEKNCDYCELQFWKGFFLGAIVPLVFIIGVLIGGMM